MAFRADYVSLVRLIHRGLEKNKIPLELRQMILDNIPFETQQYIDFCLPLNQRPTPGWTDHGAKRDCVTMSKLPRVDLRAVTRYLRDKLRLRYQLDPENEFDQLRVELHDILEALHKYTLAVTPNTDDQLAQTGYVQFMGVLIHFRVFTLDADLITMWIRAGQCSPIQWAAKYIQNTKVSLLNIPRAFDDELPTIVEMGLKKAQYCVVILAQRYLQKINGSTISVFSLGDLVPLFFRVGDAADASVVEYVNTLLDDIVTPRFAYLDDMDPNQIIHIIKDVSNTPNMGAVLGIRCLTAYMYQRDAPNWESVVDVIRYTIQHRDLDAYALICLHVFVWLEHVLRPARAFFSSDTDPLPALYRPGNADHVKRMWYKIADLTDDL
jgi:hypothetical protein